MSLQAPMRCSTLAEELAEPMAGTVHQRGRWLLVEDRGAWGERAVDGLLGAPLSEAAKARGIQVVLVRRREGDPAADVVRRVILVDTLRAVMAVRAVTDLRALTVADLEGPVEDFGEGLDGPIFLVCTNGKRDACCSLRGRALVAALAERHGDRLWESTHIGGHRFAANLVCLPHGVVYGRVRATDGPALANAYLRGEVEAAWLRGRSGWPPPAQVAEVRLRQGAGIRALTGVRFLEASVEGETARVVLATADARMHAFELRAYRLPPRPTSCRADAPEEPTHWRIDR